MFQISKEMVSSLVLKFPTYLLYKHAIRMIYARSRFRYRDGQCHTGPFSLSDPQSLVSLNSFSSTIE
jgi:hypothetical protein